jgi:hypothetical protein
MDHNGSFSGAACDKAFEEGSKGVRTDFCIGEYPDITFQGLNAVQCDGQASEMPG